MLCNKCGRDHGPNDTCPAFEWQSPADTGTGEFPQGSVPRPVSMRQPGSGAGPASGSQTGKDPAASRGAPDAQQAPPHPDDGSGDDGSDQESDENKFLREFNKYRNQGYVPLAVLGGSQSGKTVMLTRLYEHLTRFSDGHLNPAARLVDEVAAELFQYNIELLETQRWPPPTDQNRRFIYAFYQGKRKFMLIDLSGHDFDSINIAGNDNRLYQYLRECVGYLYLLDSVKLAGPTRWKLQGFFQAFINYLTKDSTKALNNPLVVAFSKADELPATLPGQYLGQQPFALAQKCAREMFNLVRSFRHYKFAYLSCAGKRISEITGLPVPIAGSSRPPYGLDDCLNFLLDTPRNGRSWSTDTICRIAQLLGKEA